MLVGKNQLKMLWIGITNIYGRKLKFIQWIFRLKTSSEHMLTLLEFLTALPEEVRRSYLLKFERFDFENLG